MKKQLQSIFSYGILALSTGIVCLFLILILWEICSNGSGMVTLDFLLKYPSQGMTQGGIFPAIVGTVTLAFLTTTFAVPFGIACAVYLNEYAKPGPSTYIVRASIRNLAGIPSIIYGLFGLALFVQALHLGTSLLSAGLTLGLLSLPYIITTTEEALKRIPNSLRESTLALGTTQYEMIRDVVMPQAMPGILTGVILTLARATGETAPILFTGAAFYVNGFSTSLSQEFMALPYHLYMLSTQHSSITLVRPIAYGTTLVLIALVFLLNISAILIRSKYRNQI